MSPVQFNSSENNTASCGTITGISIIKCIPMILIGVASFSGNALVLSAIYRFKNLQTFSNAYVGSLALTDVLASLLMPFSYTTVLLNGRWVFGSTMCQIQGFFVITLSNASMLTLLCFSIYRCYLVTTVRKRLPQLTLGRVVKCSVGLIWLLSILYATPPLYGVGQIKYLASYYSCTLDFSSSKYYTQFLFVFVFSAPLVVMSVTYLRIIKFIKTHNQTILGTTTQERPRSRSVISGPSSSPPCGDGSRCSVMELKWKLNQPNDGSEEEQRHEELEQVNGNQESENVTHGSKVASEKQQISLFILKSEYVSDSVDLHSPQNPAFQEHTHEEEESCENLSDSKSQNFQKNFNNCRQLKCPVRAQRQKVLNQYRKRASHQARLARILLVTVVIFIICWAPFAFDSFLTGLGHTQKRPKDLQLTAIWLAYTNALCNPIIYALLNSRFRAAFRTIVKGLVGVICFCHW